MSKKDVIKKIFYNNISVAQLKKILQGYSDNDTISIIIEKKIKITTTPQPKPTTKPNAAPPLLPDNLSPTCQGEPVTYKLSPPKNRPSLIVNARKIIAEREAQRKAQKEGKRMTLK